MKKHLVWDLPVRLFHWLLTICLVAQWLTAEVLEDATEIHFYIGYFTLGLVLFRLIWGFVGTKYAKFSHFLSPPSKMLDYLKKLKSGQYTPFIGHNPVGGWMLPIVILLVAVQAVSGLFMTDDIINNGPYYGSVNDNIQQWMAWMHHEVFHFLWIIIGIHLIAIAWYQFKLKAGLVQPMLDGKKAIEPENAIPHSKLLLAVLVAIIVVCFIYWLVNIAPPESIEDLYY